MIIDTSALIAILRGEWGTDELIAAIAGKGGLIPAPVIVEFRRVVALRDNQPNPAAEALLDKLARFGVTIGAFTEADAADSADAIANWGTGNGRGGPLNLLDLMVYAVAKRTGRPILCTGRDFAATDALIDPASRID